jgi:hypothetical protein
VGLVRKKALKISTDPHTLNMLGKMPHKENSCPRAGFNGRYEVVQEEERKKGRDSGQAWPFIEEGG